LNQFVKITNNIYVVILYDLTITSVMPTTKYFS